MDIFQQEYENIKSEIPYSKVGRIFSTLTNSASERRTSRANNRRGLTIPINSSAAGPTLRRTGTLSTALKMEPRASLPENTDSESSKYPRRSLNPQTRSSPSRLLDLLSPFTLSSLKSGVGRRKNYDREGFYPPPEYSELSNHVRMAPLSKKRYDFRKKCSWT